MRGGVNDVVSLPLARRARGVDQRRILAINSGGASVRVGPVIVGIEHLDFVTSHAEKDAAVSTALSIAVRRGWGGPFDMKLAVPEVLQGADVPAASHAFHVTVAHDPLGGRAVHRHPLGHE